MKLQKYYEEDKSYFYPWKAPNCHLTLKVLALFSANMFNEKWWFRLLWRMKVFFTLFMVFLQHHHFRYSETYQAASPRLISKVSSTTKLSLSAYWAYWGATAISCAWYSMRQKNITIFPKLDNIFYFLSFKISHSIFVGHNVRLKSISKILP